MDWNWGLKPTMTYTLQVIYSWLQQSNQQTFNWLQAEPTQTWPSNNRWIETTQHLTLTTLHPLLHIHYLNKATNKLLTDFKQNQHKLDCLKIGGLKLHNIWHRQLYTLQDSWHIHSLNKPTNKLLISCRQNQHKCDEHYAMKMDWDYTVMHAISDTDTYTWKLAYHDLNKP